MLYICTLCLPMLLVCIFLCSKLHQNDLYKLEYKFINEYKDNSNVKNAKYNSKVDNIPIYVISMQKSTERRKKIKNILHNIPFTYFDGIDGSNMGIDNKLLVKKYVSSKAIPGVIGCFLSHLLLLQKLQKEDVDSALILEDDIVIEDYNIINNITDFYDHDLKYDIIFLGHCLEVKGEYIKEMYDIHRSVKPLCTHAYLISKNGIKNILNIIESHKPYSVPIDHIFKLSNLQLFFIKWDT